MDTVTTIRGAEASDLDSIARIEVEAYSNPWQPDTFRSLHGQECARLLVAELPEVGVVGYAIFWWVLDQAELANLAVREEYRGRGIGGALLDRALADASGVGAETIFLEVRVSNGSAHRLYASRGFARIHTRPGYYQNPREDAWILVRRLENPPSGAQLADEDRRSAVPDHVGE